MVFPQIRERRREAGIANESHYCVILIAASVVAPNVGHAQADPRVTKSMETIVAMPKLEAKLTDPERLIIAHALSLVVL